MTKGTRPAGVDLFAGAGGMSLGFEQAGFDVVAAIENDPIHAVTHRFNFPHCAVLARSVVQLSGDAIRKDAGIGARPVEVVFGGAPCQGFSMIGQRAIDDPRNGLVREFVRIVRELGAASFVFENVKGLTIGAHRQFLEEVIEAFEEIGYSVRMPWRVLNANAYGVPQDRQRLILMGTRRGLALPEYPHEQTDPAGGLPTLFLAHGPSCADALADLPDAEDFETLWESDHVRTERWGEPSAYARALRCADEKDWWFGHRRNWDPNLLTSSARTVHTDISRRRFAETAEGQTEPISRFFKLPSRGVSNTLRAGTDGARGAFTSPRPIHYKYRRCVTVREMARLHGYPDWFRFHSTKWHGGRQVGNSVPPPLARAVAAEVLKALGIRPSRPAETLELGDPMWLEVSMSEAASMLGVEMPKTGRDRKSGAKKRKQVDIEAMRMAQHNGLPLGSSTCVSPGTPG